jgi:hypothetical protein
MRGLLIAASLVLASPTFAQQVRVINGDIEHVYGHDGELLDDADLRARNQGAWEHMQAEHQLVIQRRQLDIEEERLKLQQAALAYGAAGYSDNSMLDSYGGGWDGGGFIGPTRGLFHRGVVFRPRIGIAHRIGGAHRMGRR